MNKVRYKKIVYLIFLISILSSLFLIILFSPLRQDLSLVYYSFRGGNYLGIGSCTHCYNPKLYYILLAFFIYVLPERISANLLPVSLNFYRVLLVL